MKNTHMQKTTPVSQVLTEDNIKAGSLINRSKVRSAAMVGLALSVAVLGSHQGAMAADNSLATSSSTISEQDSSVSQPVVSSSTVPSESAETAPKPVLQAERKEIIENQVAPSTPLKTSLEKLQQTRQSLQESLKALKQEESKLKVVLAAEPVKVSDANELQTAKNQVALSSENSARASIVIPVESPVEENTSQTASVVIPVATPDVQSTDNQNQSLPQVRPDGENRPTLVKSTNSEKTAVIPVEQEQAFKSPESDLNRPINNTPQIYQVQKGDTLNQIARRNGVSVSELMKLNRISNPNVVKLNQQLLIPTKTSKVSTQPATLPQPTVPVIASNSPRLFETTRILPQPTINASLTPSIAVKQGSYERVSSTYASKLKSEVASIQQTSVSIPIAVEPPVENINQYNVPEKRPQPYLIGTASSDPTMYGGSMQIPVDEPSKPILFNNAPAIPGQNLLTFTGYIWPTKGVITSGFGRRWGRMHKGIDIGTSTGTPVVAAAAGEVISAGWNSGGYGNLVVIQHGDGSITYYAHNSRVLVHTGQIVQQGEQISAVGSTGHSTGPHLHFEVHPDGRLAVNPIAFLPGRS